MKTKLAKIKKIVKYKVLPDKICTVIPTFCVQK